jgi:hypothetical protein
MPAPDRLSRDQATALLDVLHWAVAQRPDLAARLLDPFDSLTEGMDKLKVTRHLNG